MKCVFSHLCLQTPITIMFPRKERGSAPSDDNRGQSDLQVLWFQDFLVSAQREEALFRKVNCKIAFFKRPCSI